MDARSPATSAVALRGSGCKSCQAICEPETTAPTACIQRRPDDLIAILAAMQNALDDQQAILDQLRSTLPFSASRAPMLVDLKTAARKLGCHERTMRRHARAGAGKKLFGRWRIDLAHLPTGGAR